jgi:hypothetical protein
MKENQDTSGFYKRDPGGILLFGRYYVLNANYFLKREEYDQHEYPVDGWSWYESEAEAREALGFPSKLEEAFNAMTDEEKRAILGSNS